ncbi:hypothetical protein C7476_12153 [Phyllobacterium bourgognense]|uniref:Uncharacterized protein n=1 Tax=Phyllobacterium bourgognense TaxID=314236 RepID=A0A368YIZ2_9HYPH|nr:hypothetical protein C7476_12153 [Phyllobacterium bourgognense]
MRSSDCAFALHRRGLPGWLSKLDLLSEILIRPFAFYFNAEPYIPTWRTTRYPTWPEFSYLADFGAS